MRRINWDDEDLSRYATKCLTAAWNVRYNSIHCLANLVSGLALYHEQIGIHVVDAVIEDIRLGLELNLAKYNQRRVSMVKYLAELYNYRMVESSIIFKTLYTLITYGVSFDTNSESAESLDPASNFFRIRLVCVMLDTCGQYFDRGNTKKKLDCFLVYFQRYYLFKKETAVLEDLTRPSDPVDIEFAFVETLSSLRPSFKLVKSYSESSEAVLKMEQEVRESLNRAVPGLMSEVAAPLGEDGLQAIREDEEEEETGQLREGECEELAEDEDEVGGDYDEEDEEEGWSGADEARNGSDSQNVDSNSEVEEVSVRRPKVGGKEVDADDDEFCKAFDSLLSENIAVSRRLFGF